MDRQDVDYIIVHCSATKPKMKVNAEVIDRWHRLRGFFKIGYHFVIKRDGTVEKGRELDEAGAHVKGFNDKSWGICLVGGLDKKGKPENNFTDKQMKALRETIILLKGLQPGAMVRGHRDMPRVHKACPCFDVREWWSENYGELETSE